MSPGTGISIAPAFVMTSLTLLGELGTIKWVESGTVKWVESGTVKWVESALPLAMTLLSVKGSS